MSQNRLNIKRVTLRFIKRILLLDNRYLSFSKNDIWDCLFFIITFNQNLKIRTPNLQ
jgi:hypothetical protein